MLSTFNKLILRKDIIKEKQRGDPFDVLPIKNVKKAFECEEIHLGSRGIELLVNFNKFPNLEVLWIDDNNVGHPRYMREVLIVRVVNGDNWAR